MFCVSTFGSFLFLHSFAQMAPTKPTKKPSSKCACTDSDHFKSADADMKYNDCYKGATIIMERVVHLESLEGTFIPKVFKERTWTKLLNPVEVVYSEIIREFFSNAAVDGDRIECWVRHKEFVITREIIQDFLEVRPPSQPIEVQYEDRLGSTERITAWRATERFFLKFFSLNLGQTCMSSTLDLETQFFEVLNTS